MGRRETSPVIQLRPKSCDLVTVQAVTFFCFVTFKRVVITEEEESAVRSDHTRSGHVGSCQVMSCQIRLGAVACFVRDGNAT